MIVCDSFFVVGVEKCFVRLAFDDERQFPREVVSVLDTCVHALRACRAVNVC